MKTIKIIIVAGLLALPGILPAQVSNRQPAPLDSIIQIAAEEQGLTPVPYNELPATGTFWLVCSNGMKYPLPTRPADSSAPVYQISGGIFLVDGTKAQISVSPGQTIADAVNAQASAVADFIAQQQTAAWDRMLVKDLGLEESANPSGMTNLTSVAADTNGLYLEITGTGNGLANVNLHHATNWVYALWSAADLLGPWQIEEEIWPQDTNSEPVTVAQAGRPNLFLKAEDWTEVDSLGHGLPDWWQWYWFGSLSCNATNLDDLGNTYWLDFAIGADPNVISFSAATTNNYIARMNVPVMVNISYGQPSYYAVLVDDTNFNHAVWHDYVSANLMVNLGWNAGWHEVRIGLRGHADWTDEGVWQWKRLKLDLTAPQIVITNPVMATVDKPVIQLQGYGNEALSRISYDITNAAGLLTNQMVLVEGQFYDTNTAEFSTNYFQAYDVPLTNGVNLITIHATDLAGNVTTTNFSFLLDYSAKTNPPVVQLLWPTDGLEIVGSNIVCRGWVSDDTATVTVQLVDANGNTNAVGSLVGRDGNFYASSLTLATGTNYLSYTVTDAAGNVATTNLTVMTSELGLTIDPVVAGQTLVTGTIDDDSYTVYVNGVTATNDGFGNWSATISPIGVGGGAVVVNAVLNGGDPSTQQIVDPPQGVFISSYHNHDQTDYKLWHYDDSLNIVWFVETFYSYKNWQDGQGGNSGSFDYSDMLIWFPEQELAGWPATSWPQALPNGTNTYIKWNYDPDYEHPPARTNVSVASLSLAQEHCDTKSIIYGTTERRTADTEMKLATGGPAGSRQQNLWCLSATATDENTGLPIPAEQIEIGGFGFQDSDAELWVMLPDNDPDVVTPSVLGFSFFSFGVTATKYPLAVTANGLLLSNDVVAAGADFCVGQGITFDIVGLPSPVYNLTAIWTLPGNFVNTNSDPNCDLFYEENAAFLKPPQGTSATHCWYVKDVQALTASVRVLYRLTENGRLFDQTITGKFNVHRPTTAKGSPYQPDGTPTVQVVGEVLTLGNGRVNDMSFQHTITTDAYCAGQAGYVQVIDGDYTDPKNETCVPVPINGPALDKQKFPRGTPAIPANTTTGVGFYDGPYAVTYNGCAQEDLSFQTYLMFQPPGGIWVPLRLITWNLKDEAMNGAVQAGSSASQPDDNPTTAFPKWTKPFSRF